MYQAKYLKTVKVRRTGRWVQVVRQTSLLCTKLSEHSRARQGYSTSMYIYTDKHNNTFLETPRPKFENLEIGRQVLRTYHKITHCVDIREEEVQISYV